MKYENVKGVIGLCQRDGQIRNQQQLKNVIKEKDVSDCIMEQFDDPDSDYIWCIFFNGELEDNVEETIGWIIDNDQERFW
jgi:hypothetical protein